jgi:hypothetical protein
LSWLRSNGQYNSKAIYPAVYDLLLKIYNGSETKVGVSVKLSTETFTDYDFVLNTAEEAFRLPLLNGSEDKPNYDKPISITNNGFTADKRGLVVAYASVTATWAYFAIAVNGVEMTSVGTGNFTQSSGRLQTFVEKGDVVTFIGSYTSLEAKFYPNQGNGSLYFYVGETVQNANLINAGRIEETLAKKVDMQQATMASMPSDRKISITIGASGTSYTAPADGWFTVALLITATTSDATLALNTTAGIKTSNNRAVKNGWHSMTVPVKKGDNAILWYDKTIDSTSSFNFIYAQGGV